MPHVRIFPHSPKDPVSPSPEALADWLLTGLPSQPGGKYLLLGSNTPKELAPESVVLFRHGNVLVGEGVVESYDRVPGTSSNIQHNGTVAFQAGSVRLFKPPIEVSALQELVGTKK